MSQEHPRPRRTGRLETRPDAQHLVLERSFRAPIQDVWAAVTDPDRLARWIGTWTGDPASGAVVFEMTAESAPPQPCRITVCEPPTRLGLELMEPDGAAPWTLTVVLTAHGGTTTLTFDQALGPSAPVRDVGPGWGVLPRPSGRRRDGGRRRRHHVGCVRAHGRGVPRLLNRLWCPSGRSHPERGAWRYAGKVPTATEKVDAVSRSGPLSRGGQTRLPSESSPPTVPVTPIILKAPCWLCRSHNGAMPNIQIKDVPEQTHAILRSRAAAAHQSLQEYLLAHLIRDAQQPTVEEVLDRAGSRAGGKLSLADAVSALRSERARR